MIDCVDAIWDNYPEDSLKSLTHQRRGIGSLTRITDGHNQIPSHQLNSGFLTNWDNKNELFSFLSEHIVKKHLGGKLLLSTKCQSVLSNRPCDVSTLQSCNKSQDQARISLNLAHAPGHGHHRAHVQTVDGDIVVLVICFISTLRLSEVWWVSEVGWAPQYSHPRYLLLSWTFQIYDINNFPCHQMVRHSITLPRMWQEDCLGNTPRLTDKINHPASSLGILTRRSLNGLRLSCVVRDVFRLRSMNPVTVFYKW